MKPNNANRKVRKPTFNPGQPRALILLLLAGNIPLTKNNKILKLILGSSKNIHTCKMIYKEEITEILKASLQDRARSLLRQHGPQLTQLEIQQLASKEIERFKSHFHPEDLVEYELLAKFYVNMLVERYEVLTHRVKVIQVTANTNMVQAPVDQRFLPVRLAVMAKAAEGINLSKDELEVFLSSLKPSPNEWESFLTEHSGRKAEANREISDQEWEAYLPNLRQLYKEEVGRLTAVQETSNLSMDSNPSDDTLEKLVDWIENNRDTQPDSWEYALKGQLTGSTSNQNLQIINVGLNFLFQADILQKEQASLDAIPCFYDVALDRFFAWFLESVKRGEENSLSELDDRAIQKRGSAIWMDMLKEQNVTSLPLQESFIYQNLASDVLLQHLNALRFNLNYIIRELESQTEMLHQMRGNKGLKLMDEHEIANNVDNIIQCALLECKGRLQLSQKEASWMQQFGCSLFVQKQARSALTVRPV